MTAQARVTSCTRTAPTVVGLPDWPHGPLPSSSARTVRRYEAGTASRPGGSTLQGSMRRSAVERTAGRSVSACTHPSSCSQRACTTPCSGSTLRWRIPVRKGRSSSSASSGPTWPVSASTELRPTRTRSNDPSCSSAAARARAVASVSDPANAGSETSTPSAVDAALDRPGERLAQHVLGRRWPEGHERHRVPAGVVSGVAHNGVGVERLRQLHRLRHRAPAVGVHLEVEALTLESTVGAELHLLERRDLLDEGRDSHRSNLPAAPTSRPRRLTPDRREREGQPTRAPGVYSTAMCLTPPMKLERSISGSADEVHVGDARRASPRR